MIGCDCECCQADQKPTCEALIVRDMPHMAQFVFDFYQHKLRQLATQQTVCHQTLAAQTANLIPGPTQPPNLTGMGIEYWPMGGECCVSGA